MLADIFVGKQNKLREYWIKEPLPAMERLYSTSFGFKNFMSNSTEIAGNIWDAPSFQPLLVLGLGEFFGAIVRVCDAQILPLSRKCLVMQYVVILETAQIKGTSTRDI